MAQIIDKYIFSAFGFDVLLTNVIMRKKHGEEYPDINLNELKLLTAKALLRSSERVNGFKLKFLRTFMKTSFDVLSGEIGIPSSTLRSWENRGDEITGLTIDQEKVFRIFVINKILDSERKKFDKDLVLASLSESQAGPLDLNANLDYSFVVNW